jgi:hypothetical protein
MAGQAGASSPPEPAGPERSAGPEPTAFLQRSGREEPAQRAGKKAGGDGFGAAAAPIGSASAQGMFPGDAA